MGNFTEDLAKGFIRSAVNQVGRDGGKVISNSIYGNAHSTPIRGIGKNTHNQFFDESTNEVISPEELRLRAEAEGFQVSLSSNPQLSSSASFLRLNVLSSLN